MSEEYADSYVQGTVEDDDDDFIKVAKDEESDFMEFPKEDDDTVLVKTIQTQFANAIGIKYKGSSGAWRAVREVDNALVAPKGGWGNRVYTLTFSEAKKRKLDSGGDEEREVKPSKRFLKDMAVIGLPFKTTEEDLKEFFEGKYGPLLDCRIKYDRVTKKSRGFGFVRFEDEEAAKAALHGEDYIDGRRIQVREKKERPMKMFVSGLPEGTTEEDVNTYFSKFGEIIDSYIPTPFRNFGFFTFSSTEDGRNCLQEKHYLNNSELKVKPRIEKSQEGGAAGAGGAGAGVGAGGYQTNNYQSYGRGRGMPPSHQPQRNDKAAALKNMLVEFLSSPS